MSDNGLILNGSKNNFKISISIHIFIICICSIVSLVYETIYESFLIGFFICSAFFLYQLVVYLISFLLNRSILASVLVLVSCFYVCKFTLYNINNLVISERKAEFYSHNQDALKVLDAIKKDDSFSMFEKPPSFLWSHGLEMTSSKYSSWCDRSLENYYLLHSSRFNKQEEFDKNLKDFNNFFSSNNSLSNNPYFIRLIPEEKIDQLLK